MQRTYGYARVSSQEQNEARQLIALKEKQISPRRMFIDKQSGKDFERPQYNKMLKSLRQGDLLYVLSIDRLGRNYEEIQIQWRKLTKEIGVNICVIDMPLLDTRKENDLMGVFVADLVLQILSFVSQNERENIRKRQRQGIDAAKARGVHLGRPALNMPKEFVSISQSFESGEITVFQACKKLNISPSTFYRRRRRLKEEQ